MFERNKLFFSLKTEKKTKKMVMKRKRKKKMLDLIYVVLYMFI